MGHRDNKELQQQQQQQQHDISPTSLHLMATHTTQVGLRQQIIVGSATTFVKLPSWRT